MHNNITKTVISVTNEFNVYNIMYIILYCVCYQTAVLLWCITPFVSILAQK